MLFFFRDHLPHSRHYSKYLLCINSCIPETSLHSQFTNEKFGIRSHRAIKWQRQSFNSEVSYLNLSAKYIAFPHILHLKTTCCLSACYKPVASFKFYQTLKPAVNKSLSHSNLFILLFQVYQHIENIPSLKFITYSE